MAACVSFSSETTTADRDAGAEASVPGGDARSDAPLPGLADAGFCSSYDAADYVFCDDFDQPLRNAVSAAGWASSGSVAEIDRKESFSPPASAIISYGVDGSADKSFTYKVVSFPSAMNELTISAKVLIEQGADMLAGISVSPTDSSCVVSWFFTTGGTGTRCPTNVTLPRAGIPSTGVWTPVAMTVTRVPGGLEVTTTVGSGSLAVTAHGTVTTDAGPELAGAVQISIGDINGIPGVGVIHFDDVLIQER